MKELPAEPEHRLRIITSAGSPTYAYSSAMSDIANSIQGWADRLVIDKTGLTGIFEQIFDDGLTADVATGPAPVPINPVSRFEYSTGLRLIPAKELVEVLVIDHAEKPHAN